MFCASKEPRPINGRGINISGVDFWHAVEFSRNGRFLQDPFTGLSGRFVRTSFQTLADPKPPANQVQFVSAAALRPALHYRIFRSPENRSPIRTPNEHPSRNKCRRQVDQIEWMEEASDVVHGHVRSGTARRCPVRRTDPNQATRPTLDGPARHVKHLRRRSFEDLRRRLPN